MSFLRQVGRKYLWAIDCLNCGHRAGGAKPRGPPYILQSWREYAL